ncbi:MAG: hypothetical protein WAO01_19885 [Bradyrhizobium sp.]
MRQHPASVFSTESRFSDAAVKHGAFEMATDGTADPLIAPIKRADFGALRLFRCFRNRKPAFVTSLNDGQPANIETHDFKLVERRRAIGRNDQQAVGAMPVNHSPLWICRARRHLFPPPARLKNTLGLDKCFFSWAVKVRL